MVRTGPAVLRKNRGPLVTAGTRASVMQFTLKTFLIQFCLVGILAVPGCHNVRPRAEDQFDLLCFAILSNHFHPKQPAKCWNRSSIQSLR